MLDSGYAIFYLDVSRLLAEPKRSGFSDRPIDPRRGPRCPSQGEATNMQIDPWSSSLNTRTYQYHHHTRARFLLLSSNSFTTYQFSRDK